MGKNIEKMNTSKRITSIIGAGAPLDFSYSKEMVWPSTANITKKITEKYDILDIENKIKRKSSLVNNIYNRLNKYYPVKDNWKEINTEKNINFEMLFHVLESLYAYNTVWKNKCNNPNTYPSFAPFVKPCIKKDIDYISQIFPQFILRIMDIINSYNQSFIENKNKADKWYYDFFSRKSVLWDIFNLNYDTTIENCITNYQDGFETIKDKKFMKFNPNVLWDSSVSTINHLHGCINYYFASNIGSNENTYNCGFHDLYKYNSYDIVKDMMKGRTYSNPANQTGESYYISPIITGLRKTDKITNFPLDFYYGKLFDSIMKNNSLIIIGYSFGDFYINNLIERMFAIHGDKARIVLIDYWNKDKIESQGFEHFCEYCVPDNEMSVVSKAAKQNLYEVSASLKNEYGNKYLLSDNKRLMLFVNGFKQASESADEIFSFLDN